MRESLILDPNSVLIDGDTEPEMGLGFTSFKAHPHFTTKLIEDRRTTPSRIRTLEPWSVVECSPTRTNTNDRAFSQPTSEALFPGVVSPQFYFFIRGTRKSGCQPLSLRASKNVTISLGTNYFFFCVQ